MASSDWKHLQRNAIRSILLISQCDFSPLSHHKEALDFESVQCARKWLAIFMLHWISLGETEICSVSMEASPTWIYPNNNGFLNSLSLSFFLCSSCSMFKINHRSWYKSWCACYRCIFSRSPLQPKQPHTQKNNLISIYPMQLLAVATFGIQTPTSMSKNTLQTKTIKLKQKVSLSPLLQLRI